MENGGIRLRRGLRDIDAHVENAIFR